MRYIILYIFSIFSVIGTSLFGQGFQSMPDEQAFQLKVKQIDEFMNRFNFTSDLYGVPTRSTDVSAEQKRQLLLTLLNEDSFSTPDHAPDSLAEVFIDYVITSGQTIRYEDQNWHAQALGSFAFSGKNYPATFILQTELISDVMYRWAVIDIQSPLFDSYPDEPQDSIMISPAEHGISFISLPETFNLNHSSAGTAFRKNYQRSRLAVIDFLLANKLLKVNTIKVVKYHFWLPEIDFIVEHVEKNNGYSPGWVITQLNINRKK